MGAETPFYMLAILAVGAVMGLGVSQFVRRVVGDRNAFQLRMQSEQLQKQSREMREQAERLEELETGRLRADVAQARRAERHRTQLEQLTAIRNQIAEKLEQMTPSSGLQGSSALVAATEQLLRQHERTERERQERVQDRRDPGVLDDEHVVAVAGEPVAGGGARRPAPDHEHLVARHQQEGLSRWPPRPR